jgi:hypothetical protein
MGKPHSLPLPPEAAYLAEWLLPGERGPLSFFTSVKRFGPDWTACAQMLAREKPQAGFISSFAYAYAEDAVLLAAALRERLPRVLIIAGGAGPSAWPHYYLDPPPVPGRGKPEGPVFDAVFTGEAEAGFALLHEFLQARGGHDPGESAPGFRRKSVLLTAPAFAAAESLPCVFALQRETAREAWISVSLQRGCPLGCGFCSSRLCHGSRPRAAGWEEIRAASESLPARLSGKRVHLNFEDDNLLLDERWFGEVLSFFRGRFPGVAFAAENGLDYRLLSPEALALLMDAGFEKFNLSLASMAGEAAGTRTTDVRAYLAAAAAIARRGLPLVSYFIAGLPADNPHTLVRHLAFMARAPTLAGISLFYPVPGISGFDPPPELLRSHPGLARGSMAYPWTGALSTGRLVTAFRLARLVNLIKKSVRAPLEEELLRRCFAEKKLLTLRRVDSRRDGLHITSAPADPELEKLFFQQVGHL